MVRQSWDSQMIDGVFPRGKSKDQIEFERKFKMTDDNLDDVQKQASSVGKLNSYDRAKVGFDRMDAHDKEIWNAAIEAALDKIDDSELYCAVARLKK